jgi:hypothetical protein
MQSEMEKAAIPGISENQEDATRILPPPESGLGRRVCFACQLSGFPFLKSGLKSALPGMPTERRYPVGWFRNRKILQNGLFSLDISCSTTCNGIALF